MKKNKSKNSIESIGNDRCGYCNHFRKDHKFAKPGEMYQTFKFLAKQSTQGMVPIRNMKGFCTLPLCVCIAFVEKDGSTYEEPNPFKEKKK